MLRATQRYLGVLPDTSPDLSEDYVLLERVIVGSAARTYLIQQLYVPGRARSGLLFGRLEDDALRVLLATPAGYPTASPSHALDLDSRYVLGASDAASLALGEVDWVGNWLMYADSQLGPVRHDLGWLRQGARRGLFDRRHLLIVVGWDDGALQGRAYAQELGQPVAIPCRFQQGTEASSPSRSFEPTDNE